MGFWISTIIRFKGNKTQLDEVRKTLTGKKNATTRFEDLKNADEESVLGKIRDKFFGKATYIFVPKTRRGFQDVIIDTRCTWVSEPFFDFLDKTFPRTPYKTLVDETDLIDCYDQLPDRITDDEELEFFDKEDLETRTFQEICEGVRAATC